MGPPPRVFFPDSPTAVGTPVDDGSTFKRRKVRQTFSRRMCRLVLPTPLMRFEGDSAALRIGASDSASIGSTTQITVTTAAATPATSNRGPTSSGTSVAASATAGNLPQNIRIGLSSCDPLLAFEKFVFVATCDGRVAVYSLVNYNPLVSEDVLASERRRADEWAEEDHMLEMLLSEADANTNDPPKEGSSQDEQDLKSRLRKHEEALRVEPMMVISLPQENITDEPNGQAPTVVALCAADCLIDDRSSAANTASDAAGERSLPSAVSLVPNLTEDLIGHVAILDESGSVHIVELVLARSGAVVGNKIESNVVFSFQTGRAGATCLSIQQGSNGEKHLVAGYCSGEVASYQVFTTCLGGTEIKRRHSEAKSQEHASSSPHHKRSASAVPTSFPGALENANRTETIEEVETDRETMLGPICVQIVWQGIFPVPVRSSSTSRRSTLLFIGTEQLQRNCSKTSSGSFAAAACHSLSPAVSIEVVDSSLVKKIWDKTGSVVHLSCCSIWPEAGKEMKDGWTRNPDCVHPKSDMYDKLDLGRSSVTDRMCCKACVCYDVISSELNSFLIYLACLDEYTATACHDGTIGVFSIDSKSWGICHPDNQVLLFERCIGLGFVRDIEDYLVCCLGGGTIYLLPISTADGPTNSSDILRLAVPINDEDTSTIRFAQCFAAGTSQVASIGVTPSLEKRHIALLGWAGGVIDVHEICLT